MKIKGLFILCFASLAFLLSSCGSMPNPLSSKETPKLFPIYQNGKGGYINRQGEVVIQPQFASAGYFSEGLAVACIEYDKCGYIDETGKFIINPQFKLAAYFSGGLAAVEVEDKIGYVDKEGKFAINPQFVSDHNDDKIGFNNFSEGLARVKTGDKYGFIDRTGRIVINPQFEEALSFSEGLAAVRIGSKMGFIDKEGKIVINPQFDDADWFVDGLASVRTGGQSGYIDKTGKYAINPQFDGALPFSEEGLALVFLKGKGGYIDKTGKYLINPQFSGQGPQPRLLLYINFDFRRISFSEGLAPVVIGEEAKGKVGYIDTTGKIVINPQFNGGAPFYGGLAQVYTDSGMAYIDKEGKYVWRETRETPKPAANTSVSTNSNMAPSNTSPTSNSTTTAQRTGRLTTDSNIRSEANKDAASLGIHFKGAKVSILDETTYMRDDGETTWYKIKVVEYGCSVNTNLGCGKNSSNDADEGWINAKNVLLD